jgi:hypothetical protein
VHDDTKERNIIRIDDLALPLYRIYALNRFEELLATGHDALVNPTKWDDPFENFFLEATEVVDSSTGGTISLKNLAADWYGQCWSTQAESDAMWRIYSPDPNKPGVKVKTTVRKLFDNLKTVSSTAPYLQFFVGRVDYKTEAEIGDLMGKLTFLDVSSGGQGDKFADLLCIKREAFQHEHEVRLLFQDLDPKCGADKLFKYKLDANIVFEEVVLDPRLKAPEAEALKSKLLSAGCPPSIRHSTLYRAPHFVIPIQ